MQGTTAAYLLSIMKIWQNLTAYCSTFSRPCLIYFHQQPFFRSFVKCSPFHSYIVITSKFIFFIAAVCFACFSKHIWAVWWENQQCGFWPGLTQTRLYSHWRWLEAGNFVFRKKRYCTIQVTKNKGADQLRGYREADLRLCFRICRLLVFSWRGSFIVQ